MDLLARIQAHFAASIVIQQQALLHAGSAIVQAAERIAHCLAYQGKVLACGDGTATIAAQYFAAAMLDRVGRERPGLPVLALTPAVCTASIPDLSGVFARQVQALGEGGDVLLTVASGAASPALGMAIAAARARGMVTVALIGPGAERPSGAAAESDVEIYIPGDSTAHIQEVQVIIVHCLGDLIERLLAAEENSR